VQIAMPKLLAMFTSAACYLMPNIASASMQIPSQLRIGMTYGLELKQGSRLEASHVALKLVTW
jgi:membrane protein CcdC involved in cytochrome C biogenesis